MNKFFGCVKLLLLSLIFVTCFGRMSSAELLITPMLVKFEEKDRFAVVTLVNTSKEMHTYEMNYRYFKMRQSGASYDVVDKSTTEFDLGKYLVFTPRKITLTPGAKQRIRLALRRPEIPLPAGDYRVHLEFSSIPNEAEKSSQAMNNVPVKENKMNAAVKIYVGFSIPIIFRVGPEDVQASIGQITLKTNDDGQPQVLIPVTRSGGAYSLLGHLLVYHIKPDGTEERVGEISNAHIFPEINERDFLVTLVKGVSGGGALKVVVKSNEKGSGIVYAEKTFPLK